MEILERSRFAWEMYLSARSLRSTNDVCTLYTLWPDGLSASSEMFHGELPGMVGLLHFPLADLC